MSTVHKVRIIGGIFHGRKLPASQVLRPPEKAYSATELMNGEGEGEWETGVMCVHLTTGTLYEYNRDGWYIKEGIQ